MPAAEILIVEDSATQAMRLQHLLERENYRVSVATTGAAALEAIRKSPPTLVLTDIVMPDMDGYALCRKIKTDEALKSIPVILLTVLSGPEDIIRGIQSGADNFLVKPYNDARLLARIRYILANRELRGHSSAKMGIEVLFGGGRHVITADRAQILDLLLASYEIATEKSDELRRSRDEAQRANRSKSDLLARVGQEFRAPLNAILGFAQLMETEDLGADNNDNIRQVLSAGQHLLRIADKMLDISRIDLGELPIPSEPIDWREIVIWCGDVVRPLAAGRSVEIAYRLNGKGVPRVQANRERLAEVLLNLLTNAVKYNRRGGVVTVSAEKAGEHTLRISIADTGLGIPAGKMDLLFVPFERLGAEKSGVEGVGIGLALAKRLAEAMGGKLLAKSEEGVGSTFSVDLPIARNGVACAAPSPETHG